MLFAVTVPTLSATQYVPAKVEASPNWALPEEFIYTASPNPWFSLAVSEIVKPEAVVSEEGAAVNRRGLTQVASPRQ